MKSNEEFIAGIYEKAANYKEINQTENGKVIQINRYFKAAAAVVLCVGVLSTGILTLQNSRNRASLESEESGISLASEEIGALAGETRGMLKNYAVIQGQVTKLALEEGYLLLTLENITENHDNIDLTEGKVIALDISVFERKSELAEGIRLSASGIFTEGGTIVPELDGLLYMILQEDGIQILN